VRRLVALLLFLALAEDGPTMYAQYMASPLKWVGPLLFQALPIKVRPFDLIMLAILAYASTKLVSKGPRVRPMQTTMLLAAVTVVAWFLFGVARGGSAWAASWQTYLMLSMMVTALAVAATCRTAEHCITLAKAILAAGLYRATMGVIFYWTWARPHRIEPPPEYLTTHYDTVVWALCIVILVANALENPVRKAKLWLAFLTPYLLLVIQLNNRRLAWVSLIGALLTTFILLRPSRIKRRIKRGFLIAVPIVALYVAVGWGQQGAIFVPLRALATVTTEEDASTKARNAENLGLIATANENGWLLGTGWGHGYTELTNKYSIAKFFDLWPYVPHNSVLGLLAYTGFFGFCGYWLMFPTAVFLHARTARLATRPLERAVGIVGVAQVVVCANQMYGDMGIFSPATMYVMATCFGIALRLPIEAGVWPAGRTAGATAPLPAARGA
jgi:hypothetical protein